MYISCQADDHFLLKNTKNIPIEIKQTPTLLFFSCRRKSTASSRTTSSTRRSRTLRTSSTPNSAGVSQTRCDVRASCFTSVPVPVCLQNYTAVFFIFLSQRLYKEKGANDQHNYSSTAERPEITQAKINAANFSDVRRVPVARWPYSVDFFPAWVVFGYNDHRLVCLSAPRSSTESRGTLWGVRATSSPCRTSPSRRPRAPQESPVMWEHVKKRIRLKCTTTHVYTKYL